MVLEHFAGRRLAKEADDIQRFVALSLMKKKDQTPLGVNFASFVWVHVESFGEKAHPNRKSPKNSKYNYIASGEKYLRIISRYFRTATRALIRYFFYQFIRSLRERQIIVLRKSTRPCAMLDLTNQKRRGCRTL